MTFLHNKAESNKELKIVFAHFGKRAPKHLTLNIERCKKLFPNIPIVLITNMECKLPDIKGIEISFYNPSSEWHQLDQNLSHPKEFRENFWLTSLARFLALENYLAKNPGEILHVESDVILAPDFPFNRFSTMDKSIAYPVLSRSQGIASTLYIRDHATAKKLVTLTLEMSTKDSQTTDMLILRKFYDLYSEGMQTLPIGPSERSSYQESAEDQLLLEMKSALSIFAGCFDGLDIGYFIYGVDPRNDKGKKHLRRALPNNYLLVPKMSIVFSEERNFLSVESEELDKSIPLYSLHIHSKNAKLFRADNNSSELRQGLNAHRLPETYKFIPQIFFKTASVAIARRFKNFHILRKTVKNEI